MPKLNFPKRLYVRWDEPENDDAYLVCSADSEDGADYGVSVRVAIYELLEVGDLKTAVTYHKKTRR